MYLVDTNVWLERLLNQAKTEEVGEFFQKVSTSDLSITDFTFHSICIVLSRLAQGQVLIDFVQDVFVDSAVNLISIKPEEIRDLLDAIGQHKLDFDDAYQYVAAEKNGLTLVSFDADFDRTEKGKRTPAEILRETVADDID